MATREPPFMLWARTFPNTARCAPIWGSLLILRKMDSPEEKDVDRS